ncbi:stanniocalcin family domain-containing protein [Purpureocillium lavendulum]|uniref:Stanniocalcin family domain-containing protein n=1 Tax=Purpureocillium lavendulum TaxID=1247861 RepID=A0AB34FFP9_9HYPO|nr:stanniocalcin family domain-containing protein [Purpureocillium lavendulum]
MKWLCLLAPALGVAAGVPALILQGASEEILNAPNTPFTIRSSRDNLVDEHAVFLRGPGMESLSSIGTPLNTTVSGNGIVVPGLQSGRQIITVVVTDDEGPMMQKFILQFGADRSVQPTSPQDKRGGQSPATCSCGSCQDCPGRPICEPTCQVPPQSCDFYTTCAEATLHCGPDGYPIRYGAKNCGRFVQNLDAFSSAGKAWIWRTMTCLQRALVEPVGRCGATCQAIEDTAFASHPVCYVDSGVCDLPLRDLVEIVVTVNTDLFAGPALEQVFKTASGCAGHYESALGDRISELEREARDNPIRRPIIVAEIVVLRGVQKFVGKFAGR